MPTLIDSYLAAWAAYNSCNDGRPYCGQSFKTPNDGVSYTLDSVEFDLTRVASINGLIYCKIYAHTGTYGGADGVPTGSALATSVGFESSGLELNTYSWTTFTFTGAERITLQPNTAYCAELYNPLVGITVRIGIVGTGATHGGISNYSTDGSTWLVNSGYDARFNVYGIGSKKFIPSLVD
jgi:hypothetical protein